MRGSSRGKLKDEDGWKRFLLQTQEELKTENPNISKTELYRVASDKWKHMTDDEKSVFKKSKKKRRSKNSESSDESDESFQRENLKKHISAYSVFVNEKQKEFKDTNPNLTLTERTKIIKELWTTLDKSEKSKFNNKAKCINRVIDRASSDDENQRYEVNIPASKYDLD